MANKKSQIVFDIELDENNVPEGMKWNSTDNDEGGECKASLISIWDSKTSNTMKIDLWTKEMKVDDMNIFFHQTLMTLADTYNRATGNDKLSFQMKEFGRYFAEESGIIDKQK
ncbi:MAG: gliding motility protein GldC [Crocinitomicaceae bacterium]|nr:gliding motility protein GldC [Crocinitomicaceae bacterium]|tara:strand:+ start:2763 stop:3101 length:339 start_codon:yes stop_codon:yes gene_type:complete